MQHGNRAARSTAASIRRHTFMRAFTAIVFGTASVIGVGLAAAPANAAAGAVALTGGPSGQPNSLQLVSANASGMVYRIYDPNGGLGNPITYMQPTGGSSVALPNAYYSAYPEPTIVGTMVGAFNSPTLTYTTINGSMSGTATVPGTFLTMSADGYLYTADASGTTVLHLYDANISANTKTDLGAIPGNPPYVAGVASTTGVALETQPTLDISSASLYYLSFSAPGTFTSFGTGLPVLGNPAIDADSIAWLQNSTIADEDAYNQSLTTLTRMGLNGSNAQTTATPDVEGIAITPTLTALMAWNPQTAAAQFSTMP
ncbi:MAG TPA: hypothetical protein VK662_12835, partial [Acidothermaceae bacterium]|nr:hypothetical protein [Acidothermaceae bacterium]